MRWTFGVTDIAIDGRGRMTRGKNTVPPRLRPISL
jgi:hypothetical protein